ncbi:response regulator [Candidatus Uhrbacteria bacterium]|nr:response regulator [Candidatus Uhrbacteria bacterium]
MNKPVLVIIDDDDQLRKAVSRILARCGFDVHAFDNPDDALLYIEENPEFSGILSDFDMASTRNGIQVFHEVQPILSGRPFVLLTGTEDLEERYPGLPSECVVRRKPCIIKSLLPDLPALPPSA